MRLIADDVKFGGSGDHRLRTSDVGAVLDQDLAQYRAMAPALVGAVAADREVRLV